MNVEYVSDCVALCLFSGCFSYLFSLIYFYDIDSPTFKSPLLCIFFADKAKKAIITLIIHVTLLLLLTGNYLSENKSMPVNMIVYRSTTVKSLFPGFCNILLLVAPLGIAIRHKLTICSLYLRCLGQVNK